jgi:uncharacterized membrane protein YcaP (DUF421 family)
METFQSALGLGVEAQHLGLFQVVLRGCIIFLATLLIVRIADKRFLAKKSPFDVVLGFVLASSLGRAINGSEPLFATIAVGFVLVLLHRVISILAFHHPTLRRWLKGTADPVIRDGRLIEENLECNHVSSDDLEEELRLNAQIASAAHVHEARIERNGEISVIPKD